MIQRGQIYWVDLGEPAEDPESSKPAGTRPVAIIQSDSFNESALATTLAIALSKNLRLAGMPGNVFLPKSDTGLPKDSVANVTALLTLDKADCRVVEGMIPSHLMRDIDAGLRAVLARTASQ